MVYSFDPLADRRWADFVARHPKGSVFHTPGWLRALQRTYGYVPVAFTTAGPADDLTDALLFCAVRSRLTGARLVSLPFSDHCEPLVDGVERLQTLATFVAGQRAAARWKYVEIRGASGLDGPFEPSQTFHGHRLDLRGDLQRVRQAFHKDSIQRKIRRAEREQLTCEEGRDETLLQKLRGLLDLTRQRHNLPVQPLAWFRNLVDCLGDRLCIRIASTDGRPAAGILTLRRGTTVVYKYGGSDARLNALGGMPWLFWRAIQDAKATGAEEFDFGRTDVDNEGLRIFKERFGARRSTLTYWRCPGDARPAGDARTARLARRLIAGLPGPLRRAVGRALYRHLG